MTTSYPRDQAQNISLFTISVNDAGCCLGWGCERGQKVAALVRVKIDCQGGQTCRLGQGKRINDLGPNLLFKSEQTIQINCDILTRCRGRHHVGALWQDHVEPSGVVQCDVTLGTEQSHHSAAKWCPLVVNDGTVDTCQHCRANIDIIMLQVCWTGNMSDSPLLHV